MNEIFDQDESCLSPLVNTNFNESDFAGTPFQTFSLNKYNVELGSIPNKGNAFDIKITDEQGRYIWAEVLQSEFFDKNWLDKPTVSMMITINILSK